MRGRPYVISEMSHTRDGRGANETLIGIWADHKYAGASLSESMSFFRANKPNVLVSTVKKAEDRDEAIATIVDTGGSE